MAGVNATDNRVNANRDPNPVDRAPDANNLERNDVAEATNDNPVGTNPPANPLANDNSTYEPSDTPAAEIAGAVGGTPAVHARPEAQARHAATELNDRIQADIADGSLSRRQAGPVGAVVVDNQTGQTFTGRNTGIPDNLHPVLENRMNNMDPARRHNSQAGTHAEINALNDALWAREASNRQRGINTPVTEADLNTMTMDTVWTRTNQGGGMVEGQPAARCANCTQLTDGVNNLAGDATQPFSADRAAEAGVDPARQPNNRYRQANAQSVRRGGAVGALAGAGISTARALEDGQITGQEALAIGIDTAVGAGTGAAGDLIEHGAARAMDRAAGQAVQNTAGATSRVVGGRLAGAGVAGAVIGAGFSSYDQIQAYNRGEVSASEAIGTVTAEAATGLAAGAAGAAAGAAIGSVIPVAGTVVGGAIGFGVGMAAGYLADQGLRASGVTDAIASGVTSAIDAGAEVVNNVADTVSGWGRSLASAFGW